MATETMLTTENRTEVVFMADSEPTFEQAYSRLEQVVRQLEAAPLGLDEALKLYEEGMANLKSCQRLLEAAEKRIELVTGVSAKGEAETVEFDQDSSELHEKVGRRRARPSGISAAESKSESAAKSRGAKVKRSEEERSAASSEVEPATMDDEDLLF